MPNPYSAACLVSSRVVLPPASLSSPPMRVTPARRGTTGATSASIQFRDVVLDQVTGLVFHQDRVPTASGHGWRSARDGAFLSGAYARVPDAPGIDGRGADRTHADCLQLRPLPARGSAPPPADRRGRADGVAGVPRSDARLREGDPRGPGHPLRRRAVRGRPALGQRLAVRPVADGLAASRRHATPARRRARPAGRSAPDGYPDKLFVSRQGLPALAAGRAPARGPSRRRRASRRSTRRS